MRSSFRHSLRWQAVIPHVLVLLWLTYLGVMIWQHADRSVQPLHHDPLTYMAKAMNFWKAVGQKRLFNPLSIEPASRPPGTILMSYPFGFSPDFKGFKFRSIFLPIVLVVFAVYVAAGTCRDAPGGWSLAAAAVLFSALPLFFHFDCTDNNPGPTHWGLVDNFQAGIAAMAASAFIRSLHARSQGWLIGGALLGSLAFLVKPSGLMIMTMLAGLWLSVIALHWIWARKHRIPDVQFRFYAIRSGTRALPIFLIAVVLGLFSDYLSKENFAFARRALQVMKNVLEIPPSQIFSLLFSSAGIAFILWVSATGLLVLHDFFRGRGSDRLSPPLYLGLLLSVPVLWCVGAWYWLVAQAGGNQVRYFYPFFLMGAVCLIPLSMQVLSRIGRWIRLPILVLCFLPALNIGAMLALEHPPLKWQRATGVNLSAGDDGSEVRQAYTFIKDLRRQNREARLYSFLSDTASNVFVTAGIYEGMVRPERPSFKTDHPLDWVNGFAVKVSELLTADYILIRRNLAQSAVHLLFVRQIDEFYSECAVFQAWLHSLTEEAGIRTASDGRLLQIIEVVDRKALSRALQRFVNAHIWRPAFVAANSEWLASMKSDLAIETKALAAKEIDFQGIYMVHELLIEQEETALNIEVCWEELQPLEPGKDWHLFFHLMDGSGRILRDLYLPLNKEPPLDSERGWRRGSVAFARPIPGKATCLAFGIFRSNNEFLLPDKGIRDWAGKRVLAPIPFDAF